MISRKLIDKTLNYFKRYSNEEFAVNPSLPILYFGDLDAYEKSPRKVLTVGKNPSDNEFRLKKNDNYSFCRFGKWNKDNLNLIESLNPYFVDKPLKQWFSSFEPILNGASCSYYNGEYRNRALHTDICSPLATNPKWSKLSIDQKNKLYKDGLTIWKELIEELKPDIMFISVPKKLFEEVIHSTGREIISFDKKINGMQRKKDYKVYLHEHTLNSGKIVKVIFGQAANKPFDTISKKQKTQIGALC